jgi:hypothetical protein
MNKNELCRKFPLPFQGFSLHSPIPIDWKKSLFLPHFNFCTQKKIKIWEIEKLKA